MLSVIMIIITAAAHFITLHRMMSSVLSALTRSHPERQPAAVTCQSSPVAFQALGSLQSAAPTSDPGGQAERPFASKMIVPRR